MRLRTALRPLVPHFLKCIYYQRLLSRLAPEPDALRCRSFVREGDRVIDVGANIGAYTKLLSQWVGPGGSVHSYEPVPETFSYLRHNVRKLQLSNVTVHNAGASSSVSKASMIVPEGNFYRAAISQGGDRQIQLVRLDDEFALVGRVSFIKCDAEGHEREVVKGALKLIQRDHPIWLMETSNEGIVQRMVSLGYTATHLEHDWLFQ